MRNTWYAASAIACLWVGGASRIVAAQGWGFDQNGAPSSFGQPQKPSWTQRLMSPFGGGAADPAQKQQETLAAAQAAEAQRLKFDPLALNNGVDAPTPDLMVSMAELCAHGGNVDQARQLYQRAIAMEPKHLNALLGAARMEDRAGRLDVAIMLYRRAAAAYPNNPTVLNDLGLCLARQDQLPDAERALARAVQLAPAKPLYRNNIAKVEVELNRLDAACQHLAAVYPPPVVNYNMGVLLFERGRVAEAERYLTAAAAMEPRMEPARVLLAQIHSQQAPAYQVARATTPRSAPPQSASASVAATPAVVAPSVAGPAAHDMAGAASAAPQPSATPQILETPTPDLPTIDAAPTLLPPVN